MRATLAVAMLIMTSLLHSANAQVTLPNGVTVPKERMIVFLFAGHSNMAGRCTPDDQTVHERCWAFGASGHNYWEPCKDRIFTNSSGAGPATAFLKNLANRYPTYYFGVIQNANTQVGVRWHNGDSNNRYWKGAGRYEELLGYAKGMKDKVTFGGVITMLGIMEATSGSSTYWNTFADDFTTMATAMRSDLGLDANRLPFLVQDYEREACSGFAANLTGPQAIISQLSQLSSKLSYSAIIPTNSIPCPDQCHHFDLAGMRTWSGRAADSYVSRNWNFWATVETTPPTAPGSLRAGTITENSIALIWNASTDASGIKEYVVYWGTTSKTVTGTATTTTITGLSPSTSYTFTVKATDNAGNVSSASNALTVSTISSSDNVAPSAPANLRAVTVFSTSIALAWNASTDNVGVTGYEIFQGSTQIGTTTGASATSYTATGLTASTAYSFTVKARDAPGTVRRPARRSAYRRSPALWLLFRCVSISAAARAVSSRRTRNGSTGPITGIAAPGR